MEEKLAQLTISKALMIGIGVCALFFITLYDDGSQLQNQIKMAEENIIQAEQELAVIKKAIQDAERFQKTKEVLGQELDTVLKAIPEKLTPLDLMRIISNEAKVVGSNIVSLNQGTQSFRPPPNPRDKNAEQPFFEPVSVTVALEGTYNQLMMFMSNLTRVDKIITVSNLKVSAPSTTTDAAGPTMLKLEGEFKAYRYLPQEGAKTGG